MKKLERNQKKAFYITRNTCLWIITYLFLFPAVALGKSLTDQLLMVTSSHCPWCDAFEEEVGQSYPFTLEAKKFPLFRIDIFEKVPAHLSGLTPATMTPTFIIIKGGKEIGRIVGYPGQELFWWRLSEFTGLLE